MKDESFVIQGYWTDQSFRNYLRPPNEGVIWLDQLRYGRSDYEAILHRPPNIEPANERYYHEVEGKRNRTYWRLRTNWRELLPSPDPYALCYLFNDPAFVTKMAWEQVRIWHPQKMMDLLTIDGKVVSFIMQIMESRQDKLLMKFQAYLERFFKEKYLPAVEPPPPEQLIRINRLWCNNVDKVAGCLLNNFQVETDLWFDAMIDSDGLDKHIDIITEKPKPKIKFLKREVSPAKSPSPVQENSP